MQADDHDATIGFAETALNQIKALRQAAHPRNFEVWYHYATGHYPEVNKRINDLMAADSKVSQNDIDQIHEQHFSPFRSADQVDGATSRFMEQLDLVMMLIGDAADTANRHTLSIADAHDRLGTAEDRDTLRGIVESLARTARAMEGDNRALAAQLTASQEEVARLQAHLEAIRNESLVDPLTTLANRKGFDIAMRRAIRGAQNGEPLALMMADIDHFKTFNDTYGHLIGDQVLRLVGIALRQNVKGKDVAARYGGEEFAVLLPATSLREAAIVGDHVRRAVMSKELLRRSTGQNLGRVTVSIGIACLRLGENGGSLIERADSCLYAAKRSGRNCVITEMDPEFGSGRPTRVA